MQILPYVRNMYNCRFRTAPHSDLNDGSNLNTESTKHQVLCMATNASANTIVT